MEARTRQPLSEKENTMAQCELLATCIFFNDKMKDYPAAADHLKKKMCLADPDACARFMIVKAVGRAHVPTDLFPNHHSRAEKIIDEKKGLST
jgi:hypothetical protein